MLKKLHQCRLSQTWMAQDGGYKADGSVTGITGRSGVVSTPYLKAPDSSLDQRPAEIFRSFPDSVAGVELQTDRFRPYFFYSSSFPKTMFL